jgi:hypothetical protein
VSRRHILLLALKRLGTFKKQHNRRMGLTLGEHLTNTYDDLIRIGADEDVALAGGLHSIYGTNSFKFATVKPDQRPIIRELFGERAERLAWLFCIINRPQGLETGHIYDWKTKQPVDLSSEDLRDLRLIEIANLSDNGAKLTNYPNLERFYEEHRTLT